MTKKYYRIDIEAVSTIWESCECYIEAESEEEARKLFDEDSGAYDWDNWEAHGSELRNWDVERVEYDEWMTNHMEAKGWLPTLVSIDDEVLYERARIETLENEQETKNDTSM